MPLPCFPGAEGEGTTTTHARDPSAVTLFVTNLADDDGIPAVPFGNCCYRRALLYPGPAYIHFRVSGRIDVPSKAIKYKFPNKYVACHTSPGGVCFSGEEHQFQSHDILTRFARFYTGDIDVPQAGWDNRDALNTGAADTIGQVYNLVWDHCEGRFAVDETFTRWFDTEHSTWMNGIVAEGLYRSHHPKGIHSMGMLWGIASRWVTTHRSILWACNQRMPQAAGCIDKTLLPAQVPIASHFDVVNNLIGDWGEEPFAFEHEGNYGNWRGNHHVLGPDFNMSRKNAVRVAADANADTIFRLYAERNITPINPDGTGDNWNDVVIDNGTVADLGHRILVQDPMATVTEMPANQVRAYCLSNAGAIKPFPDSAWMRTMAQIRRRCRRPGEKYFINSVNDVGGWPTYQDLPIPLDSNNDGIPDSFCVAHGLGVFDNIMNVDSGTGYSWMERYLSELAGD